MADLGACPRIGIWVKIEKFSQNKHSHIVDIGIFAYLRALFFDNSEEFGLVSADSKRPFSDSLLVLLSTANKINDRYVEYPALSNYPARG
jgi:hypothetical protein